MNLLRHGFRVLKIYANQLFYFLVEIIAFVSRHNASRYETRTAILDAPGSQCFVLSFAEAAEEAHSSLAMNMHQKAKFNFTGW